MPVSLVNLVPYMQTFNLPEGVARVRHTANRPFSQADGSVGSKDVRLMLPDSVTLLARGTRGPKGELLDCAEDLPDQVEFSPEVAAALRALPPRIRLERRQVQEKPSTQPHATPEKVRAPEKKDGARRTS